jgi:hypothetical protein
MGRPPPPAEAIALAWSLKAQRRSLSEIREILKTKGYKCDGLQTVARWAEWGAEAEEYIRVTEDDDGIEEWHGLDRKQQRWVLASGLDQIVSKWFQAIQLANNDPKVLDVASTHLRWAMEFRAKLTNDFAPAHPTQMQVSNQIEAPKPREEVLAAIRATQERKRKIMEQYRDDKGGDGKDGAA